MVKSQANQCLLALEYLVAQNASIVDSPPSSTVRWPTLIAKKTNLELFVSRYQTLLLENTNAREVARLFG